MGPWLLLLFSVGDILGTGIYALTGQVAKQVGGLSGAFSLDLGGLGITGIGLAFMALIAAINFRGVGESVKFNVLLTCVELTGLLINIGIGVGLWFVNLAYTRREPARAAGAGAH